MDWVGRNLKIPKKIPKKIPQIPQILKKILKIPKKIPQIPKLNLYFLATILDLLQNLDQSQILNKN